MQKKPSPKRAIVTFLSDLLEQTGFEVLTDPNKSNTICWNSTNTPEYTLPWLIQKASETAYEMTRYNFKVEAHGGDEVAFTYTLVIVEANELP